MNQRRILASLAALLALGLLLHGPIAQWASYHAFADQRGWLGIPHAADVLSNLPFALIGAWALWSALLGYALAKGLELADHAVFNQLGLVSGHTLKHLAAAGAALWLLAARRISCGSPR